MLYCLAGKPFVKIVFHIVFGMLGSKSLEQLKNREYKLI